MLHSVDWQIVTDVSKEFAAYNFIQQFRKIVFLNEATSSDLLLLSFFMTGIHRPVNVVSLRHAVPLSGVPECEVPVSEIFLLSDMLFLRICQPL
jgi:hypothetical protein